MPVMDVVQLCASAEVVQDEPLKHATTAIAAVRRDTRGALEKPRRKEGMVWKTREPLVDCGEWKYSTGRTSTAARRRLDGCLYFDHVSTRFGEAVLAS